MDPQLNSRLCQLPNEVLCLIADHVFNGFKLQYSTASLIRRSPDVKPSVVNLLKSCRKLRQILMPILARKTKELVVKMPWMDPVMEARRDQVSATKIKISPAFLAGITDLNLVADTKRFPDYRQFPNLKRISMRLEPIMCTDTAVLQQEQINDAWVISVVKKRLDGRPLSSTNCPELRWHHYRVQDEDEDGDAKSLVAQYYKDKERLASGVHLIVHQTFRIYRTSLVGYSDQTVQIDVDAGAVLVGLDPSSYPWRTRLKSIGSHWSFR